MTKLDKLADEQLMAVTLAKLAAHNKQRRVAAMIVTLCRRLDIEMHQVAGHEPLMVAKEGE